jgi:hypothetical protein
VELDELLREERLSYLIEEEPAQGEIAEAPAAIEATASGEN